ncbi:MAG: hypothetical protein M5U34_07670 [Chloroflexi bacterium]|nr:hypothetical protein [Chloroflexota bacterium]
MARAICANRVTPPFRIFRREHHQIGQLVDDDDDIGHFAHIFFL